MMLYERDKENIQQGVEMGFEKAKLEHAKALLDVLEDEVIAEKIRLPLDVVIGLRREHTK